MLSNRNDSIDLTNTQEKIEQLNVAIRSNPRNVILVFNHVFFTQSDANV